MGLLDVKNLSVAIGNKQILEGVDLEIDKAQVFVLFGPNGSGKSTLLKAVMGIGGYSVTKGDILFEGRSITGLPIEERARMGISIMFQHPPGVRGVKLSQIARMLSDDEELIRRYVEELNLGYLFDRDLNVDFSGGEMKRAELLQILLSRPKLILLDEPESGVDLENISIMGKVLNNYLVEESAGCFVISHTGYIIDYINAQRGCLMIDGNLYCVGDPKVMFETIKASGYEKCKECHGVRME